MADIFQFLSCKYEGSSHKDANSSFMKIMENTDFDSDEFKHALSINGYKNMQEYISDLEKKIVTDKIKCNGANVSEIQKTIDLVKKILDKYPELGISGNYFKI